MGFLELFVTASMPVLNVLIMTGVGSFLAIDYIGILGGEALKNLNNVTFYVFNPALVASNLSRTLTWDSMVLLWFMPINILLTFIIGSALGWLLIQITKTPFHLRGLILGCCSAGNLGNLLLIIVPSICKEKGSPFGAPDVCESYGLSYASLSLAMGAIFLWSYVYNIVRISSTAVVEKLHANGSDPTLESPEENTMLITETCTDEITSTKHCFISVHYKEDASNHCVSEESSTQIKVPISVRIRHLLSRLSGMIDFRKLFAPSTIGVIIGYIVGVVPQMRKTIILEGAPLRVIQESAYLLGEGAIPTATLIMGGNLVKGLQGSGVHFSHIFGILVVRYIVLPLFGIFIVKGAIHLGMVHSDPLYQFILLLQYALPPAMNIGTMTQLFGVGESECSVIFLCSYAFASVSLTLWSMCFMWLVT